MEQKDGACKNCAGEGIAYLSFLGAGPAKTPITSLKPSTFVEKSERNGEGWYVIERTKGYLCPACQGERAEPPTRKRPVEEGVREVVGALGQPRGDE